MEMSKENKITLQWMLLLRVINITSYYIYFILVALAEENLNNLFASNQSLFSSLTAPTNPLLVSAAINNPDFMSGHGPQELIAILEQSIVSQNRTNSLICSYLSDLVHTMSKFDGVNSAKKNKKRKHFVLDNNNHTSGSLN